MADTISGALETDEDEIRHRGPPRAHDPMDELLPNAFAKAVWEGTPRRCLAAAQEGSRAAAFWEPRKTHWAWGTSARILCWSSSEKIAARLAPHDGQRPLPLHEKAGCWSPSLAAPGRAPALDDRALSRPSDWIPAGYAAARPQRQVEALVPRVGRERPCSRESP